MIALRTVLMLRLLPRPASLLIDALAFRRPCHLARNVMDAKRYLLRCAADRHAKRWPVPSAIFVDAGAGNNDIKTELERWLDRHPRLRRVRVVCTPASSWLKRLWNGNR
jgi:hypothetical protein